MLLMLVKIMQSAASMHCYLSSQAGDHTRSIRAVASSVLQEVLSQVAVSLPMGSFSCSSSTPYSASSTPHSASSTTTTHDSSSTTQGSSGTFRSVACSTSAAVSSRLAAAAAPTLHPITLVLLHSASRTFAAGASRTHSNLYHSHSAAFSLAHSARAHCNRWHLRPLQQLAAGTC